MYFMYFVIVCILPKTKQREQHANLSKICYKIEKKLTGSSIWLLDIERSYCASFCPSIFFPKNILNYICMLHQMAKWLGQKDAGEREGVISRAQLLSR